MLPSSRRSLCDNLREKLDPYVFLRDMVDLKSAACHCWDSSLSAADVYEERVRYAFDCLYISSSFAFLFFFFFFFFFFFSFFFFRGTKKMTASSLLLLLLLQVLVVVVVVVLPPPFLSFLFVPRYQTTFRFNTKTYRERHGELKLLIKALSSSATHRCQLLQLTTTWWCEKCVKGVYSVSTTTFSRLKCEVANGDLSTELHRPPRLFPGTTRPDLISLYCRALNKLCREKAAYLPDDAKRIIPYRTWRQCQDALEVMVGEKISRSQFAFVRQQPSCADIRRQRTTTHEGCDICSSLGFGIQHAHSAEQKHALGLELNQHLNLQSAHRSKFYDHNDKARYHECLIVDFPCIV